MATVNFLQSMYFRRETDAVFKMTGRRLYVKATPTEDGFMSCLSVSIYPATGIFEIQKSTILGVRSYWVPCPPEEFYTAYAECRQALDDFSGIEWYQLNKEDEARDYREQNGDADPAPRRRRCPSSGDWEEC